MDIRLDIYTAVDWNNKARYYNAECHYEINEHDHISTEEMDELKGDIEKLVNDRLNGRASKNNDNPNKYIDDWVKGVEPIEINIHNDPLTKEITVTKIYKGV